MECDADGTRCELASATAPKTTDSASRIVKVHSHDEWTRLLHTSDGLILIDCYADWCPPCRWAVPLFSWLSRQYTSITFAKVDVDAAPDVSRALKIKVLPTFKIFSASRELSSWIGPHMLLYLAARLPFIPRPSEEELTSRDWPWIAEIRATLDEHRTRPVDLPVEIMPHLLLGDKRSAGDLSKLEALGITHIVNVAGSHGATDPSSRQNQHYLQIHAEDEEGYPIIERHASEALAFISGALRQKGKCLIHCQAGINRSGVLACAALMLHERIPVTDAVARCKAARKQILINHSFQAQLVRLARKHDLLGPVPKPRAATESSTASRQARKPASEALKGLW